MTHRMRFGATGVVVSVALYFAGISTPAIGADAASGRAEPARAPKGGGSAASIDVGPWQVKPPKSGQWTAKRRSKDGIAWVRDDGSIAYFQAFPLPRVATEQAFVNEVRTFTAKVLSGSGKGKIVDANYAIDRVRSYPCVKASLAVEAPAAASAPGVTANTNTNTNAVPVPVPVPVPVQSRALVCHSKDEPEVGVFIGFSYPGAVSSRALEADAQAFISGTTLVPGGRGKWER